EALLAYQQRRYQYVRAREAFAQALFEVFRGRDAGDRSLRDAVFRYWESPRARRRSMEILVGEESRTRVFAAEYARVAVLSAMLGTHALVRDRSLARPAAALSGVVEAARTGSQIILDKVVTAARARSLDAPPGWV